MLSFEIARRLAEAVLDEGQRRRSSALTVGVLDAGGHQLVLYRQDGSGFIRNQIAIGKAWGALSLGFSSRGIATIAERVPAFYTSLTVAAEGRMFPAPGGVLLRADTNTIIGAVGVSGDNSDTDEACAIIAAHTVGLVPDPLQPST
ncbi:heme-binding protein [Kribbella sp. NPDC051620]|uniref:heme-binding protein n=1 Tax=Kribbella sp. NPDC051620 TaxID=3364120 RepID=UPI003794F7FD